MKPFQFWSIIFSVCVIVPTNLGCVKEENESIALRVSAGEDQLLHFPINACQLIGSVSNNQNNLARLQWKKISGPAGLIVENTDSMETKVRNLEIGEYQFEFTVADIHGLQRKDTVNVSLVHSETNEVVFENQSWSCPMGCWVKRTDLHSSIYSSSNLKVYVRESDTWVLVNRIEPLGPLPQYAFDIFNNDLVVYASADYEATAKVDIKITF